MDSSIGPETEASAQSRLPEGFKEQIDELIAELGPEKSREVLELLLTEMVMQNDPESDTD